MWTEEKIEEYLRENIKESRYIHTLGVKDSAEKLCRLYGADEKKARIAALLHDAAKNKSNDELLNIAQEHGYTINDVIRKSPALIHGFAAAVIGKEEMGIIDIEILDAVTYHTTGRENMTLLDKIIYLADYIEPSRDFPGVEDLRKLTYENIDKALLMSFDNTIKFVIAQGGLLHRDTIEARNYLICKK